MGDGIAVRDAQFDECRYVMEMIWLMVCEMQKFGGRLLCVRKLRRFHRLPLLPSLRK